MITDWVCWLAGLWDADRGSTAKGVVSIKNKCYVLISGFIVVSVRDLGIDPSKFRARVTEGFSRAIDVYYTSMRARRVLEGITRNKVRLYGNCGRAFIAGKLDGDGYVNELKHEIYIGYGVKHYEDAVKDSELLTNLGIKHSITGSGPVIKLRMLRPKEVAEALHPYVLHPTKSLKLASLLR